MAQPPAEEFLNALRMKLDMKRKIAEKTEAAHMDMQKQVTELQIVCVQMSEMFSCADNKRGQRGGSVGGCRINALVKDADVRIKMCRDMHQQFVLNMWERRKIVPPNWDKFTQRK